VRTRLARQPRAVRQQVLDGDGRIVRSGTLEGEPGQVVGDRIVEPDLSLLPELHDCGGGKELAVRCHAEARIGLHGPIRIDICMSEAPGPHQLITGDDADDDAW